MSSLQIVFKLFQILRPSGRAFVITFDRRNQSVMGNVTFVLFPAGEMSKPSLVFVPFSWIREESKVAARYQPHDLTVGNQLDQFLFRTVHSAAGVEYELVVHFVAFAGDRFAKKPDHHFLTSNSSRKTSSGVLEEVKV